MRYKKCILTTAVMVFSITAFNQQKQPNIVLFFLDDMGWMDTSVPFGDSIYPLNKRYHTPNMERLAREGMKFTNAYATPVCTPSRTSLLTGMNAARHRVTNWTSPKMDNPTDQADEEYNRADWNYNGLSGLTPTPHAVQATTLPMLLRDAGYFTVHVGKAHWGSAGTPGANPYNLGFLVNIAGHAAGHPQSYLGKDNYGNIPGKASWQAVPDLQEYHGSETFLTEALTLEAIKAMEDPISRQRPFFLHMAHYAVHDPIQPDQRFVQKYLDAGLPVAEANYASLLEGMDKSLGDLMDFLQQKGITENTIILFMSDNGGLSYTPPRAGTAHTHNYPLRAGKGSVYEGGIREPMLVKWPGKVRAGSSTAKPVIIEDFFPSILEMAGIKESKTIQQIDGKSFVPVLTNSNNRKEMDRALIWHIPNKWQRMDGPGINYFSAIRLGDWKLVYSMRRLELELYNLKEDIGELRDLAHRYPEKVQQLANLLSDQLKIWNAPMPVYKASGKQVPWPNEIGLPVKPRPNAAQLAWQEAELGMIFHYDLHVFDTSKYRQSENRIRPVADYNQFNPKELDVEQWVLAAKSAGARFALITATHETGFALYPSDANPYNVKLLKWRNGKADLLRDFVDACHKHGIKPGVYIGIRWNSFYGVHDFVVDGAPGSAMQKNRQEHYNRMVESMVTEICTRYGPLFEIWFDGGASHPAKGAPDVLPIVKKYQPGALFYHNDQLAEARWGGSESGTVAYPCWSTFPYSHTGSGESALAGIAKNDYALLKQGDPEGRYWMPAMADAPLRGYNGRHEWFWEPGDEAHIFPLEKLMEIYNKSVGRNSTLIIGITPDNRGLVPDLDQQRLQEWGKAIDERFGNPLATVSGKGKMIQLKLKKPVTIKDIVVQEDILEGHRVKAFQIQGFVKGKWQILFTGSAIGHKFIHHLNEPLSTDHLRLIVTESSDEAIISNFSVY
ncbi:sulfatase-like hydrolase/transferase [Flavihumibacter sp. UBA7668]|uniref:sulfatase-like hydrolase/transferase n=1 Tax=Flavihumibacter sp. UBA7668 TaxID=1946542 RepID=UPI0025C1EFBC|nr:sulfatase-like hydrolase/transferase [Flavihumibacter sp. UBA7668]